ncbi:hypothetical protein EVAR_27553_1 [Eumeta japonica]|uniref:Uncharacterized protein n=1 Tax=Eumeta variegata TaxID=151549 RepID=A0A4C1WDF5_EUMVA|nr:hypothetical protein EVAR_27553_1 [Eumeta japonica]
MRPNVRAVLLRGCRRGRSVGRVGACPCLPPPPAAGRRPFSAFSEGGVGAHKKARQLNHRITAPRSSISCILGRMCPLTKLAHVCGISRNLAYKGCFPEFVIDFSTVAFEYTCLSFDKGY